jgi:8-oxo-dGTP diphosphatase
VSLYLVRHAHAGSRSVWHGDDDSRRPLTDKGVRQSEALALRLAGVGPNALLSSPYERCRQTLAPLASATGLTVESSRHLAEGSSFLHAIGVLLSCADGTVLCSHGDVIPDVISALARRGTRLLSEPIWAKASVWVLERNADDPDDPFPTATVWPPPAM